ncbi:hypothetical protein IV203_025283 [Nitzschia inconspicua]|uniref:YqaJ viral recombinase domain-containing protein n=1 Tax=Nitzschia inconspicua TaxID=303405 RepID=A0A9K3P9Q6_9STRA|nr:hypothetical protein IV203_024712 [Nitzschia inconspicua]KAG7362399.1 hypothetical protein IV203_025283 [Nitzschia inconspicua]
MPRWVESGKWQLMTLTRFVALQNCTRGFAQIGRTGCDEQEQWMEQGSLLKHMHDIEVAIFQRSVETLVNHRNGCIVVDDELIASRATDVEQKVVSNRKRGKEGPVADFAACSLTSICFGMRLRSRSETNNVDLLLNTIPFSNCAGYELEVAFDRGYGKLPRVTSVAQRQVHVITVAGTLGSRHPFNTADEWNACMQKWAARATVSDEAVSTWTSLCHAWNIPGDEMLGTEVSVHQQSRSLFQYHSVRVTKDGGGEAASGCGSTYYWAEIKTRTAASTIEAAEAARSRHGKTVICVFGDDIFNDCVPAANRSQVMHQAVVTQFDYGMFVTSKVDDGSGSIVQVVIIEIPTAAREEHASKLCAIANPLLGFLHRQNIVENGRVRRKCVLCFVSGNKVPRESRYSGVGVSCSTTYMCRICVVPLCKFKTTDSEWKCCHAVWHERQNLKLEISRQGKQLLENRERNDNDARKRRQHAVNAYNKRRSPTKDGPQSQLDQEMEPTNQSPTEIDDTIRDENKEEDAPMSLNEFL